MLNTRPGPEQQRRININTLGPVQICKLDTTEHFCSSAMGNDQLVSHHASAGCRQPGPGRGVDVLMQLMDRVCCIRGVSIYLHRMITTSHAGFRHVLQCLDRDLEGFATVLFCSFSTDFQQIVTQDEWQTNKQVQKKIFINFSSSWLISFSASRTITKLFLIDDKSHTVFYRGQAQ